MSFPKLWLAPMEGITDRCFRKLSVACNEGAIDAVCTEFVRVTAPPLSVEKLRDELGDKFSGPQHGIQLMGNKPDMVAISAANAAAAGADYVDLNFGCPAPRVYQHCAGSAMLDDLDLLEQVVRKAVDHCAVPVSAKIRAGGESDAQVEEIAQRIEQAGAASLCIHGRLRIEKYSDRCDWSRITRAVAAVSIPVVGNGGVDSHQDIKRMMETTGCQAVMIGRAALSNPWIFCGKTPSREMQIDWLSKYTKLMEQSTATPRQALGRLKQAVKYMSNAKQLEISSGLASCLRAQSSAELLGHLH